MNDTHFAWWPLVGLAALLIPVGFALAAVLATRFGPHFLFRRTSMVAAGALILWAVVSTGTLLRGGAGGPAATPGAPGLGFLPLELRLDLVTALVLGLVTFLGFVILRFSRAYLAGDPGQARYVRWLMATLAAVTLLVISNNLLVIALAWMSTGLSLHKLLTFYPERPQAQIAAHKKFLVSRLADLCLLGAVTLIGTRVGSLNLDAVHAWVGASGSLPPAMQFAAVLLAVGTALKCAQLPFHGWLIQVMEAPTPVSALLHAGVVNLGGLVMIRLAPLMVQAEVAQMLLVVVGTATAVIAALVMTTRVSIKVSLAWSTSAQMGFMLLQCGLGAYSLALLHLIAHSLYKAHAFLGSGSAVETWRTQELTAPRKSMRFAGWLAVAGMGLATVTAVGLLFGVDPSHEPALWVLALVLALALTPGLVRGTQGGVRKFAVVTLGSLVLAGLYFTWHALFGRVVGGETPTGAGMTLRLLVAGAGFAALFLVHALLASRPHGRLARTLYPGLFAGFYLDEIFTRATFRLWPPPRTRANHSLPTVYRETLEA